MRPPTKKQIAYLNFLGLQPETFDQAIEMIEAVKDNPDYLPLIERWSEEKHLHRPDLYSPSDVQQSTARKQQWKNDRLSEFTKSRASRMKSQGEFMFDDPTFWPWKSLSKAAAESVVQWLDQNHSSWDTKWKEISTTIGKYDDIAPLDAITEKTFQTWFLPGVATLFPERVKKREAIKTLSGPIPQSPPHAMRSSPTIGKTTSIPPVPGKKGRKQAGGCLVLMAILICGPIGTIFIWTFARM